MPIGDTITVTPATWNALHAGILEIEQRSFPPSIQDSADDLRRIASSPTGIILATQLSSEPRTVVGYAAADVLEHFAAIPGIASDPHFKKGDSVYLESVAVHPDWRGRRIGSALIAELLRFAALRGFLRATAHVASGRASHLIGSNPHVLASFENWYDTGRRFDYVEVFLK